MEKISPVEIRKQLKVSSELSNIGIGFVCVPYRNNDEKNKLIKLMSSRLDSILEESEE